jgi:hypothetical protein
MNGTFTDKALAILRSALPDGTALPVVFDPEHPAPLAIGAHEQLATWLADNGVEPQQAQRIAGKVLRIWTAAHRYVDATALDLSQRYNLDGTAAGPVSDEHRHVAAIRLHVRARAKRVREHDAGHLHQRADRHLLRGYRMNEFDGYDVEAIRELAGDRRVLTAAEGSQVLAAQAGLLHGIATEILNSQLPVYTDSRYVFLASVATGLLCIICRDYCDAEWLADEVLRHCCTSRVYRWTGEELEEVPA